MINSKDTKISVVGSAGSVGATTAYALTIAGLANELVLVDIAKEKIEGEALDLNHCADFVSPVNVKAGDYPDTAESDIVIITAGVPQKPGESRLDLVNKNAAIMKSIVPEVVKYSPNCILLIVSNPVDILAQLAWEISGFPKERVIGSGTVLDTSRLKNEIGKTFNVDPRDVCTYIMGEHGDTEFPAWSLTNIQGIEIKEYAKLANMDCSSELENEIYKNVRDAAYEVIKKKGATYYAIGLSTTRIVRAILKDEKCILPVSTFVEDYYGADSVYMGVPAIVGIEGVERVLKPELAANEIEELNKSAKTLSDIKKAC